MHQISTKTVLIRSVPPQNVWELETLSDYLK
jgi:hypothetical protein